MKLHRAAAFRLRLAPLDRRARLHTSCQWVGIEPRLEPYKYLAVPNNLVCKPQTPGTRQSSLEETRNLHTEESPF